MNGGLAVRRDGTLRLWIPKFPLLQGGQVSAVQEAKLKTKENFPFFLYPVTYSVEN